MGINKVILVGHVGKDPVVQYVKEDLPVAKFTLATSETSKDKNGQKVTNTEWHNIVVWRGLAKIVEQYVKKGQMLYIEGKLSTRSYEKDGVTKYFTEIIANNMEMLGRGSDSSASSATGGSSSQVQETNSVVNDNTEDYSGEFAEGDDLPF